MVSHEISIKSENQTKAHFFHSSLDFFLLFWFRNAVDFIKIGQGIDCCDGNQWKYGVISFGSRRMAKACVNAHI